MRLRESIRIGNLPIDQYTLDYSEFQYAEVEVLSSNLE